MIRAKGNLLLIMMLIFLIFIGCIGKNDLENKLKRLDKKSFYGNHYSGWAVDQQLLGSEYKISKLDLDTLKTIIISLDEKYIPLIIEYEMVWPLNPTDTCFIKMDSKDTLYYYVLSKGERTFIVGEYGYRFNYMKLDSAELEYYLLHEDSLRKVKGNDLPKLPK